MRMLSVSLLATFALGLATIVSGASNITEPESIPTCRTSQIAIRLPPSLNFPEQPLKSSYKSMPPGWLYGNWKVTYSSQPFYLPLLNLQWDPSPFFPQSQSLPGQNNDLSSYQLANSAVVQTAYGVDTPRRSNDKTLGQEWDDVYDFVGTGTIALINNSIDVLAWGYDTDGIPYLVLYETPVAESGAPADIDIESLSDVGPSETTLHAITDALLSLRNAEITQLVGQIVPLVQNGARQNLGLAVCDAACVNNTNLQ